jgi:hypothetical protein
MQQELQRRDINKRRDLRAYLQEQANQRKAGIATLEAELRHIATLRERVDAGGFVCFDRDEVVYYIHNGNWSK